MKTISRLFVACFALISLALASPVRADAEKRIAFVVGNAAYQAGALATPANDAGLIAQTLQAAGFDVSGARDLDGETLRGALRDFLDKAQASGPDTVAFMYLGGYGAQLDGDNYFMPVDAKIAAVQDVAIEAVRISDYTKRLAGLPLKASFVVLDAARASPFGNSSQPLAGGLALVDPDPNMLIAFNAAPGTVAPAENGSYGAYAQALAEMIREGGLSPADVFDGVRLRVNEVTKGGQVPWDVSRISAPFVFFERAADAPPPALAQDKASAMRSRPLQDLGAQDAYAAVIERDTLEGYEEFLAAYPSDPLAKRIRGLVAARREAMTWRQTRVVNTPDAYWSYLDRYPRGPHASDARRRLREFDSPRGAACVLLADRLRHSAAAARRDRLCRSPRARLQRSGVRLRAAATNRLPGSAAAFSRLFAATAADWTFRASGPSICSVPGLDQFTCLRRAAAWKCRLQQHSQHDNHQQQ